MRGCPAGSSCGLRRPGPGASCCGRWLPPLSWSSSPRAVEPVPRGVPRRHAARHPGAAPSEFGEFGLRRRPRPRCPLLAGTGHAPDGTGENPGTAGWPAGRPAYRYLPVERKIEGRTVLIAEYGRFRIILTMSLQTLVTQSSHARNNLVSFYERHGHRLWWRDARRRRGGLEPGSAGCTCAATGRRPAPGPRRDHLVQAGDRRRRGHRRGEMAITCFPLRPALPGCQRRKLASAIANAMNIRCARANAVHRRTGRKT
jgi:hypothetical protein